MAARKPREFKPTRKSGRAAKKEEKQVRTKAKRETSRGASKAAPVDDLEIIDDEEVVQQGRLDNALVYTTTAALVLAIILVWSALGNHYGVGPFGSSFEPPTKNNIRDPGALPMDLRILPE